MHRSNPSWSLTARTPWRKLTAVLAVASLGFVAAACSSDIPTKDSKVTTAGPGPIMPSDIAVDNGSGTCLAQSSADGVNYTQTGGGWKATNGPSNLNCVSEDVDIALADVAQYRLSPSDPWLPLLEGQRIECTQGQTIYIDTEAHIQNNAN